jgi:hypothetical protein
MSLLCSVGIKELSINVFTTDGVPAAPRAIERPFSYQGPTVPCLSETD